METNLQKQMTTRHITMLALGGAIGAGLFKGSGGAIGLAGPSVLVAFLLGGLILFVVMTGLGQLVLSHDKLKGGMSGVVQPVLGDHAADFIDWLYWSMWIINIIAEAVALASFMQVWFPTIPVWVFVFGLAVLTTLINLYSVRLFAETEYWLALAKITVIVLLILFGLFLIGKASLAQGLIPTVSAMNQHGGFAPFGLSGMISSLLVVIYSYGGSELIAVTVSETADPKTAIPRAIRGVMGRIVSFYLIPMLLLLILYPWTTLAASEVSPFVLIFEKMHIPYAADIVNFVIILALFSSINSGVYASSRTLFFRLQERPSLFAKKLTTLNHHQVPQNAVIFCTGTLYIGVIVSYFIGEKLFGYLVGSLSYTVLLTWVILTIAAFVLAKRTHNTRHLIFSGCALVGLSLIFIGILINNALTITALTALLYAMMFFSYRKPTARALDKKSR